MGATKEARAKTGAVVDELREDIDRSRKENGQVVVESARRHPVTWASVGTAVAAGAMAVVGLAKWRQSRRTPQGRAKRAWRSVSKRFSR
jgi:hypothetical protein